MCRPNLIWFIYLYIKRNKSKRFIKLFKYLTTQERYWPLPLLRPRVFIQRQPATRCYYYGPINQCSRKCISSKINLINHFAFIRVYKPFPSLIPVVENQQTRQPPQMFLIFSPSRIKDLLCFLDWNQSRLYLLSRYWLG